jgi:hypothetical protein
MEEKMKSKVFTVALLISVGAVAGVWAQNLPGNIWTSPQSAATEGRYRSNADDFIRPDNYSGVKFNKWFGMVSFGNKIVDEVDLGALATVGFATKVNNVYIGAFYSGDFWTWAPAYNYTERQFIGEDVPAGGKAGTTYDVYSTVSVVPSPVNNAAVLIGIADMGFRLTYRTNYQSFKKSDIVIGNATAGYQLYENYQAELGYIAPQIAWAMAKNLTGNGIRPYATFDLVFNRDYQKTELSEVGDMGIPGEKIGRSHNRMDPSFAAGMGGYTFLNKDGFRLSADVDYVLTFYIYDNEYSYVEGDKYKIGKIQGTYSPGSFPYVERSYVSNLLTPSLSGQWSADRLALKFKVNLPLTVVYEESNNMTVTDSKLHYYGTSEAYTTFTFRPDLRLAMQYKIIPDRLTLNAGARIQTTALTQRTIDNDLYDENGKKANTSKVHEESYGDNSGGGSRFVSRFHLGPTFNFTENAWVEAATGVTNANGNNAIDVFAPGGLFSFGSIMVGLKF